MKVTKFFLSALSMAALFTACTNEVPDIPANVPDDGLTFKVALRVADEPASRGDINDESLTPLTNEAKINNAVILIYTKPLSSTLTAEDKVVESLYFTFTEKAGQAGVWESPGIRAEGINLDVSGAADAQKYYAMALVNVGNIAADFKGMALSELREYTLPKSWNSDFKYFMMTSVTDCGIVNKKGDHDYSVDGFQLSNANNVIEIPMLTVQRVASRVDFKLSYTDQTYDAEGEAANYTGLVTAADLNNKCISLKNVSKQTNKWDQKLTYYFPQDYTGSDTEFTFSFKARSSCLNGNKDFDLQFDYQYTDNDHDYRGFEATDEWQTYTVTVGKANTWAHITSVSFNIGHIEGDFEIDDVSFKGPDNSELMKNGDMESDPFDTNGKTNWGNNYREVWMSTGDQTLTLGWGYRISALGYLYPVSVGGSDSDLVFLLESVQVINANAGSTYAVPHFNTNGSATTDRWFGRLNGNAATSDGGYSNGKPASYVVTPTATLRDLEAVNVFDINTKPITDNVGGYHLLNYVKEYRDATGNAPTSIKVTGKLFKNKNRVVKPNGALNIFNATKQNVTFTAPLVHQVLPATGEGTFKMIYRNTVYHVSIAVNLATSPFTDEDNDDMTEPEPEPNPDQPQGTDYTGAGIIINIDGETSTDTPAGNTPLD